MTYEFVDMLNLTARAARRTGEKRLTLSHLKGSIKIGLFNPPPDDCPLDNLPPDTWITLSSFTDYNKAAAWLDGITSHRIRELVAMQQSATSPAVNVFNAHTSPVAMTVYDDVHEDILWSGTRHYANASIAKQSLMMTLGLTVPRLIVKGAQGFDGLHVYLDEKLIAVMLPIEPIITEPTPVWDVDAPWANRGKPLDR